MGETRSRGDVKKDGTDSRSKVVPMWLSLKIQDKASWPAGKPESPLLLISIPKKIVRLAVQRNRLKRLVREAFRKKGCLDPEKAYLFRVAQDPGVLGLKEVQEVMSQLL